MVAFADVNKISKESVERQIVNLKKHMVIFDKIKDRVSNLWLHREFVEAVQIVNQGWQKIIDDYEQEKIDFLQFHAQFDSFIDSHINEYYVIAQKVDLPETIKTLSNRTKLISIENHLGKLLLKINEYKKHPGIEEYETASNAANNIYFGLNALLNEKKAHQLNLKEFKEKALIFLNSDEVKEDIKVLGNPRGLKIKTIVSNIMIALATLIVGYPLFLVINNGFFKPSTDSANEVNALSRTYSRLDV